MRPDISLVIACYNEETLLAESVRQTVEILDTTRLAYEMIFVDDCSCDRTRELIGEIVAAHPDGRMRKLFHERNTGRGGAVSDGFRMAQGEVVGYIDIDLEVHARYIPSHYLAIKKEGYDAAIAYRVYKFHWRSLDRYILSRGYAWLKGRMLKLPVQDTETGFKFFRREKLMPLLDEVEDKGWFWDTEIMARACARGWRIKEIPCLFVRRFDKVSSVSSLRDSVEYFRRLWRFRRQMVREMGESGGRR
mgnify:CR=1 FL=1